MESSKAMTVKEALAIVELALAPRRLTNLQVLVFCYTWSGLSYTEIAQNSGYEAIYIKEVGSKLWQHLSKIFGEKITKTNVQSVLRQHTQDHIPKVDLEDAIIPEKIVSNHQQDWGEVVDISRFYGRTQELAVLEEWIVGDRCRVITILGMGGIGKTALAVKLAQQIQGKFEYVIWRSLRNAPPVEETLATLIKFLSNHQETNLPQSIDAQVSQLLEYLHSSRCLLLLDNAESILESGDYTGRYREGYEGYGQLVRSVAETFNQSCLVITSREKPIGLDAKEGSTQPVRTLQLKGLDVAEGGMLLTLERVEGLWGSEEQKAKLVEIYQGNPLALKIISTSIQILFDGNISEFLEQDTTIFKGIRQLLEQQFKRLSGLEKQVMFWLTINQEPVSASELQADIVPSISRSKLLEALESLKLRSLIEKSTTGFTQQPVVMEYITEQFIEQAWEAITTGAIQLLIKYALIKAQAKDYVRDSQTRLILEPIVSKLRSNFKAKELEDKLSQILLRLREEFSTLPGYGGGNIINLLRQLKIDLAGYDFSGLTVWQAYLQNVNLSQVNFTGADLAKSVFTHVLGNILAVAFSPDGKLLATSDTNGEVILWQVADGKQILTCKGHTSWVWSVTFSPDGKTLASGSNDLTVKLWDTCTGRCFNTLLGHSAQIWSVAFSPDGRTLASGSLDNTVKLWDFATGQCLKTLQEHTNWVHSVAFSYDGRILASGSSDHTVKLWDFTTGQCLKTLQEHIGCVWSVDFSSDGCTLASSSHDHTIKLWDIATGQCLKTLIGHTNQIFSVTFSPDGHTLASGSNDLTVKLWDTRTGQCFNTLSGHSAHIWNVAFSPDGRTLVSGSDSYTINWWQVSTGQCFRTLQGYLNSVFSVAFSPDGLTLISGSDDLTVKIWDAYTGQCLNSLPGHTGRIWAVDFSLDGRTLASGGDDCTIKLWDSNTAKSIQTLEHKHQLRSVAFAPLPAEAIMSVNRLDSQLLATGNYDHTVKLWDINTGECFRTLKGHTNWVHSVVFSSDGQMLASGSHDHTINLWDVNTGECLKTLEGQAGLVWSVAFSPNGKTLVSSHDHIVKLWDVNTGECLKTFEGHASLVLSVKFSPDGYTIASGSHDCTVKLWDVNTGECLKTLEGHINWIWSISFSPNGEILASGSQDETIKLWNIKTGKCLKTLRAEKPYEGMQITGVTGLTQATIATLKALGAVDS